MVVTRKVIIGFTIGFKQFSEKNDDSISVVLYCHVKDPNNYMYLASDLHLKICCMPRVKT